MKFVYARRGAPRISVQLQSNMSECGLACIAMIASFYGNKTSIREIRQRFPVSDMGATASQILGLGLRLQLVGRALKLDIESLKHLTLPCIIHWKFCHFVVLTEVTDSLIQIVDPSIGIRQLSLVEASEAFTGVALEFFPSTDFRTVAKPPQVRLRDMVGRIYGIRRLGLRILSVAVALELISLTSPLYLQLALDNSIGTRDERLILPLACGFTVILVLQHCVNGLRSMMIIHVGQSLNLQWRTNLFIHLLRLPISFFRKRHLGDLMSKIGSVDAIQKAMTLSFFECIIDGAMALVVLTLIFFYSRSLCALAGLGTIIVVSVRSWQFVSLRVVNQRHLILSAEQNTHYLETIRGIKTIKLFDGVEKRRSVWSTLLHDQVTAGTQVEVKKMSSTLSNSLLSGIERIVFIALASRFVLAETLTLGTMVAIVAYREQYVQRVSLFFERFTDLLLLKVHTERLADILCNEGENLGASKQPFNIDLTVAAIELQGVEFRHSRFDGILLSHADLTVTPRETVAIVGTSGCGKSTLMNLLTGECTPSKGAIRLFGLGLDSISRATHLSLIGIVSQDDILFAGSIAENIALSGDGYDLGWVRQCALIAAIDEEIMSMPMAYETLVGDMGSVLSGGQKQRILIARAVYKRPRILLMDEATSHLDVASERRVSATLKSLSLTILLIAHRPETIATADRVIELKNGKLIEL